MRQMIRKTRDSNSLGRDDDSTFTILNSVSKRFGRESSKDGRVDRSNSGTSQESRSRIPTNPIILVSFLNLRSNKQLDDSPSHRQVNADRVSLLHATSLQDVGDPTRLPQQLGIADLPGLTGLVGFVDDGRLVRVGVSVSIETVVGYVEASFRTVRARRVKPSAKKGIEVSHRKETTPLTTTEYLRSRIHQLGRW